MDKTSKTCELTRKAYARLRQVCDRFRSGRLAKQKMSLRDRRKNASLPQAGAKTGDGIVRGKEQTRLSRTCIKQFLLCIVRRTQSRSLVLSSWRLLICGSRKLWMLPTERLEESDCLDFFNHAWHVHSSRPALWAVTFLSCESHVPSCPYRPKTSSHAMSQLLHPR